MSEQQHSPLPWAIDPDPELDWNFHIVQQNAPHMRVCFMTSNGPSQANAKLIVRSVNGADLVASIWEDQRTRINVRKDWPELAEAIDKLVGAD